MKITVEFELPHDDHEYDLFKKAAYTNAVVFDTYNHLRSLTKHAKEPNPAMDELFRWYCELMSQYQIEL